MSLIRRSVVLFLIPLLAARVFSQENSGALKLSISEAQAFALRNNRTIRSSRIDVDLANKKIWENLALGLPQITTDADYMHQFVIPEISLGPYLDTAALTSGPLTKKSLLDAYKESPVLPLGVMDNITINFTLSQLVFSGQYFVGLQATKIVREVSEKELIKTEDETKESVAGAYYSILVLQENIRLLKEGKKALDQTYDELVKMNELGLNEETDVDQMNISRSNIKTMVTSLESQKDVAVKLLKLRLGIEFDRQLILTDSLSGIISQGNLMYPAMPDFTLDNSVDYQMAGIQEALSEVLLKLEKSKYLPTLSAFYRHQEQTNQPSFNFAVKDLIGATFNLPIFSSGMRSAKVNQAKLDLAKIRLARQDAGQGLIMEFETAWNSYQTAYSNYVTNRVSMDLSKKIYDRTFIKYREGVATSFELAQNQNQYLTAETNYYNSLLSLLNSRAKLDRILRTN